MANAAALLVALSAPARADFSSCVASLRAEAPAPAFPARAQHRLRRPPAGYEGARIPAGPAGIQDSVWDYLAALVDEERVSDGKAAMAQVASALATAEQRYGVSRYVVAAIWGVESDSGRSMGKRPLVQSLGTLACFGERAGLFSPRTDGDAQDHRQWRRPRGSAQRIVGGRVRTDAVHAFDIFAAAVDLDGNGRRDIVDSRPRSVGLDRQLSCANRAAARPRVGFEVKLPEGYAGPTGRRDKAPMAAWAARRVTPGRRARGLARARPGLFRGRPRRSGLSGDEQFRGDLFLQRLGILRAGDRRLADRLAGGGPFATPWPTDDPGLSRAERRNYSAC